jgi:hypothetical protein
MRSRIKAARLTGERRVLAGMRRPLPARQRGEGRAARDVLCDRLAGVEPALGAGAAAAATSCDDAPCPTGRAAAPSRRGPQSSLRTLHLASLSVENETNGELVPSVGESTILTT